MAIRAKPGGNSSPPLYLSKFLFSITMRVPFWGGLWIDCVTLLLLEVKRSDSREQTQEGA